MNYRDFLPELKSTTLFQNIEDGALIALLEAMKPEIVRREKGAKGMPPIDMEKGMFCVVLKGKPLDRLEPRLDVYNMPQFNEPGMMMGEIPCLSEMTKSRAPRTWWKWLMTGAPPAPSREPAETYLLKMSGEMVTKFYGEQYAAAQGRMLLNFLGILAQKVTDIRKEKADLAAEAARQIAPYRLNVFCAGVSMKLVKETADKWNTLHSGLPVVLTPGGSVDLIRDCIAGDPCDVLISADDGIIRDMMMPKYADGYRVWAGNKMVITGEGITAGNWEEKLLAADATFKHHNPYGDPGGYRAVMAMLLADAHRPGLAERLMNHPGHIGMEKNAGPFGSMKEAKYEFGYYSGAKSSGRNFAELPAVMDLSDPALADTYAKVGFAVDGENTVTAAPITHALTIPITSAHKEAAKEFAGMFLELDKEAAGFLPREGVYGKDPVG
jgi:ABC-type molybdate transport system substrate-binding protein